MRSPARSLLVVVCIGIVGAALTWAFLAGRTEREHERERERAIAVAPRASRGPGGEVIVSLDVATQERLGIRTDTLETARRVPEVVAYGLVVDPLPLANLSAELSSAEASVTASRAAYARAKTLRQGGHDTVSQKVLDNAEAQLRTDESRVRLAAQKLADEWGVVVPAPPPEREAFIQRLISRQTALVRVSVRPGEQVPTHPAGASVSVVGPDSPPLTSGNVFRAPSVDPHLQGRAFFLELDTEDGLLPPGAAVTASLHLATEAQRGVVIPRAAVVWFNGAPWAYARVSEETFVRRPVRLDQPMPEGWFTETDFAPGESVVVIGAAALLSEEQKAAIQLGQD